LRDWSEIIEKIELNDDRFFSSHFIFSVSDEKDFLSMIGFFPQELPSTFRLTNAIICTPDFGTGGSKINIEDKSVFELTLSIFPATINNSYLGRKQINQYMNEINEGVKKYKNRVEKSRKLL